MIRFSELDKTSKDIVLPCLFDILYENMHLIAPGGMKYQEEKERYIQTVSRALGRESRQILLCMYNDTIAGFVQYYTTEDTLMIEEAQMSETLQGTLAFYKACRRIADGLPDTIVYIEAFADKRNVRSQKLMQRIGMVKTNSCDYPAFVYFRGNVQNIKSRFFR